MKLPTHITIEVTTVCNIDPPCVMCGKHVNPENGWINHDAAHFPKALIPKLASALGQAEQLSLYGVGEPLTCPYLFDFVPMVPKTCYTVFTSNGWLVGRDENIQKILDNQISLIDFSLDAGTQEAYGKIRHGNLAEVAANIKKLLAARQERGSRYPKVCLNMCLMRENMSEAADFVRLAHEIGAEHAYLFHMNTGMRWKYDWFDYDRQHCHLESERHDECIQQAVEEAQRLNVSLAFKGQPFFSQEYRWPQLRIPDLPAPGSPTPSPQPGLACDLPWRQVIIFRSGRVQVCCWQGGDIGNLNDASLEELWEAAAIRRMREALQGGSFSHACTSGLLCPARGRV